MSHLLSRAGLLAGGLAAGIVLAVVLLLGPVPGSALAEDVPGLTDPRSPLIFPPLFRAQMTVSPIWITLSSGKLTRAGIPDSWELDKVFHLPHSSLFLDLMARVQAGRFSLRGYYEPRDLTGEKHFQDDDAAPMASARFSYPGVRIGGDMDVAQWNLSRVGLNIDYDLLAPKFTETSETADGFRITGRESLTVGIHGVYNPGAVYWGMSPILEFRARWPVSGAELTEVTLAAGAKAPETVLGSLAWKSGYRHTIIEFSGRRRTLNLTLDGWFSELAYYY
jgi:hypothetical protein